MSFAQFLQIVWNGRWRLLLCVAAALAGTLAISTRLPKSYEAKARVILEVAQADPVTGVEYNNKNTEAYVRTQQLLATSDRVAEGVVDKLGWATNPEVVSAWQEQTGGTGDIRAWAAQRLLGEVAAYPLEGGGTMEIAYRAPTPDAAETITRFLRESYVETTLALQNEAAAKRAQRFEALAKDARAALADAQAKLIAVQRETGTLLDPTGNDLDRKVLPRLQNDVVAAPQTAARRTRDSERPENDLMSMSLRQDLVAVEQQIASAGNTLGTDNPNYRALLARRAELVAQLGRAGAAARNEAAATVAMARQLAREPEEAYQAERKRVLSRGDDALRIDQAERLVSLRRGDLIRLEANLAAARQSSERSESGLVVMGDVITNPEAVFPDIPLNALLAALFGLGFGLASVIIDGLWRREVHGAADLASASGVPVLAVVPGRGARSWWRWPRWPRKTALPA